MVSTFLIFQINLEQSQFEKIPLINQMLINAVDKTYRGDDYKLNDVLDLLN